MYTIHLLGSGTACLLSGMGLTPASEPHLVPAVEYPCDVAATVLLLLACQCVNAASANRVALNAAAHSSCADTACEPHWVPALEYLSDVAATALTGL